MKVKVIAIILVIIMAMLVITACGSSGASEQPADVTVETEDSAKEPSDQAAEQLATTEEKPEPAEGSSDIGAEKVKEIVLAKVPGAVESSIYEFEIDYDDGRLEYEGSLYHNGYEYEFEVDGATGNILKWEIDD